MPKTRRGDVDLSFTDTGSGAAVLLHTGGCGDGRMWELAGYVSALAGYRVLNMDHRGHGGSGMPASLDAHRLPEYVDDVGAVLDAADVDRAAIVGYSAGASVAYATAASHPERIAAVVGIGAIGTHESDADDDREFIDHVREVGTAAVMLEFSEEEDEPAPTWLLDNLSTTPTEMFALMLEAWSSAPTNWENLESVRAATLLIGGELEEDDAGRHLVEAAATLSHGEAAVLQGLGHLQVFWRTDVTVPIVAEFLRRTWPV